jgi:hypothetical protein
MKKVTIEYYSYKYEELSESAKENAVLNLYHINVNHDWWDYIYEDASMIGCKISEFDLDRGSYCKMSLDHEENVLDLILKNHGESSETYKIALAYKDKILDSDGNIDADIANDFKKELEEEYLSILRQNYEYLTSEEAIIETILANDYDFKEDGTLD